MEIEIKEIEIPDKHLRGGFTYGRFVVSHIDNRNLGVYASPILRHAQVADQYSLDRDKILGGGEYSCEAGNLEVWGRSTDFGGIPQEIGERIGSGLAAVLEEKGIEVKDAVVELYGLYEQKEIERWKQLGFN